MGFLLYDSKLFLPIVNLSLAKAMYVCQISTINYSLTRFCSLTCDFNEADHNLISNATADKHSDTNQPAKKDIK